MLIILSIRRSSFIVGRSFLFQHYLRPLCTRKNQSPMNMFDLPHYLDEASRMLPPSIDVDENVKLRFAFGLAKKDAEMLRVSTLNVADMKQESTFNVAEMKQESAVALIWAKAEATIAINAEKQRSKCVDAFRMQQLSSVSLRYVRHHHVVAHVRSTLLTHSYIQVPSRDAFFGRRAAVRRLAVHRHPGRCEPT